MSILTNTKENSVHKFRIPLGVATVCWALFGLWPVGAAAHEPQITDKADDAYQPPIDGIHPSTQDPPPNSALSEPDADLLASQLVSGPRPRTYSVSITVTGTPT